jgi:hypothetical protein
MFTIYDQPIPVHSDFGTLQAVACYDSRKHRDKVLVFQTGEKRYIHLTATDKRRVGSTCTIKKPSYNSFERKKMLNILMEDE